LLKESYAAYQSMPAEERKLLDETFHLMAARMDKAN